MSTCFNFKFNSGPLMSLERFVDRDNKCSRLTWESLKFAHENNFTSFSSNKSFLNFFSFLSFSFQKERKPFTKGELSTSLTDIDPT